MKLRTRLVVVFATITIMPIFLTILVAFALGNYQIYCFEQSYGLSGTTYKSFSNSIQLLDQLTEETYNKLEADVNEDEDKLTDFQYLDEINEELQEKNSFLLVRTGDAISYVGDDKQYAVISKGALPEFGDTAAVSESGTYLGGDKQMLIKQIDKQSGETLTSAFIITDVSDAVPEVKKYLADIMCATIFILVITGMALVLWIYRGIIRPLGKMREATQNIKQGNLDFEMIPEADDELGQLCKDFEEMRIRLKDTADEKLILDAKSKELISNISHDLKTPITAIKGYAEGIIDGVADTPEKQEKYIRTIYNKADEMNILINELTLYSQVDTHRIPYNFSTILATKLFDDCAEDLTIELESKNVEFGYHNYVEAEVEVIADPRQIERAIHNIVNNSLKYMDKKKQRVNLRIKDVGDFVQVEIEDNGKGIASKDLPHIFERFYRTDASRNSATGGSGIGLSIVKRIVEEHGGKIWATSKDGVGTVMYFVIRKYQEVPTDE